MPAVALDSLRAQVPTAPGTRVDAGRDGGEVVVHEAVRQMEGKPVRAIQVAKAQRPGTAPLPLDAATAESFVRNLQTRVGQPFAARKVSADVSSLWTERRVLVQGLAAEVDGEIVVTFVVELEIEIYDSVEFAGLDQLDRGTVDSLLGLTVDRQVTRNEAESMRKVLLSRYLRDGYAFCSIELEELPLQDAAAAPGDAAATGSRARRRLRFVVDEGPKVTIGKVSFTGNTSFPADPIFGLFGTGTYIIRDARIDSDPARGFINGAAWSREVIQEDLDKLQLFYRGRGFLDATVDLADVKFGPDRDTVDLAFVVVEGPRYTIRSVRIQHVGGDRQPLTIPPLHAAEVIAADLKVQPGEFYDQERLQRDVQAIQDFYGRRGHPPANYPGMDAGSQGCLVLPPREVFAEGNQVDIVFEVNEGVPKKLRDVVIRGNRFTRDRVIRRRIRVLPGQTIDMVEVRRGLRAIEQTRYFQDPTSMQGPRLQLEPVSGQPEYVDIGLDVQDGATGELRWGIGISTGQGAQAQVTFNKRNFDLGRLPSSLNPITAIGEILDNKAFHGGGQQLQMLLAPGSRFSQFQLGITEPDLFGDHFDTYEGRINGRRIIRRLPDGYTSDVLGAELGLSRNYSDTFNAGVSLRHETASIEDLAADATLLAFDAEGKTELRGARLYGRLRDYDDFQRPTDGYEVLLSGEMVGGFLGGEESLTKLTHTANLYVPVTENEMGHRTVLHLEHFFGLANEFGGSDDVFLTERFYMGGQNLRGFDFRRAGPKQFGRPIGGEATYTATAEIFFPLVATRMEGEVRDRELLRWGLFTDIGFLGTEIDDPTFREMRASSGIGIRIEIPFLEVPIALDLGWPWLYEESDDRRQLFFSISR
ncbi:MAG: BamA/TamA family outer membrane protein [Planctomycetes bacterium]|nr:BamA/TamA family outer membrane protein [Planctomycetota bacterium]